VVSTRCQETEFALDARYSVSLLGECGEEYSDDLLWHLDRIDQTDGQLDGTYHRRSAGSGAVVYVMDTGIRADHREFGGRVIAGFDTSGSVAIGTSNCRSDNKALDPCIFSYDELAASSHGTGVASIIAGRNVGVAPAASLVSVRVMNERGLATTMTYIEGLNAIIRHAWSPEAPVFRTAVINISGWVLERLASVSSDLTAPYVPFSAVEEKMREMIGGVDASGRPDANGKRFFFVVAGNNLDGGCGLGGTVDRFPAILGKRVNGMVTVGGMTEENRWWVGSCRGGVEVLAPARAIFSATITAPDHYRGRRPNMRSGTSFAAPIIAGIAARLLGERPDLSPAQLEALVISTPSRIVNPAAAYADGKVAFIRPAPSATAALPKSACDAPYCRASVILSPER
jgi:subtilisin family serine protease